MLREFSKTDWYGFSGCSAFDDYGKRSEPLIGEVSISLSDWPHMHRWLKENVATDEYSEYLSALVIADKNGVAIAIGDQWWHLNLEGKTKMFIITVAGSIESGRWGLIDKQNLEGFGFERIL